jgi:hypothetical protein
MLRLQVEPVQVLSVGRAGQSKNPQVAIIVGYDLDEIEDLFSQLGQQRGVFPAVFRVVLWAVSYGYSIKH